MVIDKNIRKNEGTELQMNGFEWNGNQMYIFDKCERFVHILNLKNLEMNSYW
jgi:hypothetical protein